MNTNFGDYLDAPPTGDGLDDQVISGDGSIGDGLQETENNL